MKWHDGDYVRLGSKVGIYCAPDDRVYFFNDPTPVAAHHPELVAATEAEAAIAYAEQTGSKS